MEKEYQIEMISYEDERIYDLELLRHQVFHLKTDPKAMSLSYSLFHIKHHHTIPFSLSIDNEIVAGCYVTCYKSTLFIDYLFVSEKYQNTGLRLGRQLLSYILENKELVEKYFKERIQVSKLTANNEKSKSLYKKLGFTYEDNKTPYMTMAI